MNIEQYNRATTILKEIEEIGANFSICVFDCEGENINHIIGATLLDFLNQTYDHMRFIFHSDNLVLQRHRETIAKELLEEAQQLYNEFCEL